MLVTGRANAGKTGLLYDPLLDAVSTGESPMLALPSAADVSRAESEFASRGLLGVRVVVFDALISELWTHHGDGRRPVDPAPRAWVLEQAIEAISDGRGATETPGFLRLMEDIVRRMAGLHEPESAGRPERLVMRVAAEYFERISVLGLVERGEMAALLAADPPVLPGPLGVNRFTDLSPTQEQLLVGLARDNHVGVSLLWEEGFPATECLDALVERLARVGAHHHVAVTPDPDTELAWLEERLYRPSEPVRSTGAVRLAEAAGTDAEATLIARLVAEEIEAGVPPERIAVAFREPGSRTPRLLAAMKSSGVDVDIETTSDFSKTQFGRAFLALLDVCSGREPTRERLLSFVLTPYSGIKAEAAGRLDVELRRTRTSGLDWARSNSGARAGSDPLLRALRACRADAGVQPEQWMRIAAGMLANAYEARGLSGVEGRTDGAAHGCLVDVVDQSAALGGAGISEAMLRTALAGATVVLRSPERDGAVQVAHIGQLRSRRFDTVVLAGMTAREFSSERPEPLAAELLRKMGLPAGAEERLSERLLFYASATRARNRLVLVRQHADERDEPVRPSVFWDEVLDLYRSPDSMDETGCPLPVIRQGRADLAAVAPSYSVGREARRARPSDVWRPERGVLKHQDAIDRVGKRDELAVSEIETYLACPYRWFVSHRVAPASIDAEFDAGERGSLAHVMLSTFYRRWRELTGARRVSVESLPQAIEVLESVSGHLVADLRSPVTGIAEEISVARAREWTRSVIVDDVEFLPDMEVAEHEFAFGHQTGRQFEFGGVALRGRIDRVDAGPNGLLVTDYKSSGAVHGAASFETQGLLQVVVYAAAASRLLDLPLLGGVYRSLSSLSVRGFYDGTAIDLGPHASGCDAWAPEQISDLLDRTRDRVCRAAEGIRAGSIPATPGHAGACEFCLVRQACDRKAGR
jgi:hypothetical protein